MSGLAVDFQNTSDIANQTSPFLNFRNFAYFHATFPNFIKQFFLDNFLCTDSIISSFIIENMYSSKASDYIIFHTKDNPLVRDTVLKMFLAI